MVAVKSAQLSLCAYLFISIASSSSQQQNIVMKVLSPQLRHPNATGNASFPRFANHESPSSLIFPLLVIALLLIVIVSTLIYYSISTKPVHAIVEPEMQFHLCDDENAAFEYKLVLRLGCPSALFDMNSGWIDFQLTEQKDRPVNQPFRLKSADLTDPICGELIWLIGRLSPLPPITGILAHHSEPSESIFFYEYLLYDQVKKELIETHAIHDYITSKQTLFRPIQNLKEEFGLYPVLPEMQWNLLELANLGASLVLILGAFTMLAEWDNLYIASLQAQHGSLARSMFDVLYALPIICFFLYVFLAGYKYNIKKKRTQAEYLIEGRNVTVWTWAGYAFHGTTLLISGGCITELIILGKSIAFCTSLFWFSSLVVIIVCAVGLWSLVEKSVHVRRYLDGSIAEKTELAMYQKEFVVNDSKNCNLYKEPNKENNSVTENKTLYFTVKQVVSHAQSPLISAGPKLKNLKPKNHHRSSLLGRHSTSRRRLGNRRSSSATRVASRPVHKRRSTRRCSSNKRHSRNRRNSSRVTVASKKGHSSVHIGRRHSKRVASKVKLLK